MNGEERKDLIAVLKHRYGKVYCIEVEGREFWLKGPSKALVFQAANAVFRGEQAQAGEMVLHACLLEEEGLNDLSLLEDATVAISAGMKALEIIELKKTSLTIY